MENPDSYLDADYDDDQDIDATREEFANHYTSLVFRNVDSLTADALVDKFKKARTSERRRVSFVRTKVKNRKDRIGKAIDLLNSEKSWRTSTNETMEIKKMTPRHATRSLALVLGEFGRWVGDSDITYEDLGLSYPINKAPLVKALTRRSAAKETKKHRELDELSDMVFRAARSGGRQNLWETIEEFSTTHSG